MFDFFEDHPVLFIILVILGLFLFLGWIANEEDKKLRECFFQEPRTAECEYKLWKYGARNRNTSTPIVVPARR